jgi:hypothetical protein
MAFSRKALFALAVLCAIGAGSYAWFNRGRPPEEIAKEAEEAQARQTRDTRAAEHLVEVKNEALADLENGQFAHADAGLLNLATAGARDPIGRDWTIERLMAVEALDLKRDSTAYEEALDRAQTSVNLENALESKSPIRHYLAGKLGQARHSAKLRVFEQHIAAGTAPGDPVQWCELYQAQLSAGTPADLADSEGTLKMLKDLAPDNLYVQLAWLGLQARRQDKQIVRTLHNVRGQLDPILVEEGSDADTRLSRLMQETQAAAVAANWQTVASKTKTVVEMAQKVPEVDADRRRIERPLSWHLVSDLSHAYYQKHRIDRRLPSAGKPVQFRELDLSGSLAKVADAREARFVDFDSDGRLDIALLRSESFEIFSRDGNDRWEKVVSAPLPRGGYSHFLIVDLGGTRADSDGRGDIKSRVGSKSRDAAADMVLFGPSGVLVLESRAVPGSQSRTLSTVDSPALARATKDAVSVVACDLNEDGLIDLVVSTPLPKPAEPAWATLRLHVFSNRGDRHFRDTTLRSGLDAVPIGGASLLAVDWDNDLDVDLLAPWVTGPSGAPGGLLFLKGRGLARFRPQPFRVKDSEFQSATSLAVLDADSNGSWDLLASNPHGMFLLLTSSTEHGRVETIGVEAISEFPFDHVLVFDYDNDGSPDLIAWNQEAVHCFHGSAEGHFEPADDTLPSTLRAERISSADFGDFDQDGDSDLVVVKSVAGSSGGRVTLLRNEGGNANNWIDVRLTGGRASAKPSGRIGIVPAFGLGSTLCLKIRGLCQTQIVQKPVTHFGIGSKDAADVLRVLWNTGVPVNVLSPAKNTTVTQSPPTQPPP